MGIIQFRYVIDSGLSHIFYPGIYLYMVILKLVIIGMGLLMAYRMLAPTRSLETSENAEDPESYTEYEIIEEDDD